jgi:hypothetical protein
VGERSVEDHGRTGRCGRGPLALDPPPELAEVVARGGFPVRAAPAPSAFVVGEARAARANAPLSVQVSVRQPKTTMKEARRQ